MERRWDVAAIFWALLVNCGCVIKAELSSHRLCANEKCDEPVSVGIALMRYFPSEKGMISLQPNDQVTIYSHPAGSNPNLLGVEVNGVRGYVPRQAIRETKMKKWAKDMVEVEPWLLNPSAGHRRPLQPPQPPYSPEWVQGSGQLRPRPSDWHHKYMHSLRQRQENQQQQPTAQAGPPPPPQPAKTDHPAAPPPAADQPGYAAAAQQQPQLKLWDQQPAAAGLDASGGHRSLFGSADGAAAATPPDSAQVEPAQAGQPAAATGESLPPTHKETDTSPGVDLPSAELGHQPAAAPQTAGEIQQPAPVNERNSEDEPRDVTAPVKDTPKTDAVSPQSPIGSAEEVTSTSQPPEPAAGTGEAGQMAAPLQHLTAGSTLNDVDHENDTATEAPPLPDPLLLPNAAVVAEQSEMSVHSAMPNEIPVPNQPVLPNQSILPDQPVTAGQPVMPFNAMVQDQSAPPDQPVVPTQPTPEQPVVPTQPTPEQPVVPTQPTPEQPVVPTQPTPDQPVVPTQPTPEQPVVPTQPTPEQPVVPTQPTPDQPVVPTQPTPDRPAEAVQPTEGQPLSFGGSQWPITPEPAAAAASAALDVDLPQLGAEQPSPPSTEQTTDLPGTAEQWSGHQPVSPQSGNVVDGAVAAQSENASEQPVPPDTPRAAPPQSGQVIDSRTGGDSVADQAVYSQPEDVTEQPSPSQPESVGQADFSERGDALEPTALSQSLDDSGRNAVRSQPGEALQDSTASHSEAAPEQAVPSQPAEASVQAAGSHMGSDDAERMSPDFVPEKQELSPADVEVAVVDSGHAEDETAITDQEGKTEELLDDVDAEHQSSATERLRDSSAEEGDANGFRVEKNAPSAGSPLVDERAKSQSGAVSATDDRDHQDLEDDDYDDAEDDEDLDESEAGDYFDGPEHLGNEQEDGESAASADDIDTGDGAPLSGRPAPDPERKHSTEEAGHGSDHQPVPETGNSDNPREGSPPESENVNIDSPPNHASSALIDGPSLQWHESGDDGKARNAEDMNRISQHHSNSVVEDHVDRSSVGNLHSAEVEEAIMQTGTEGPPEAPGGGGPPEAPGGGGFPEAPGGGGPPEAPGGEEPVVSPSARLRDRRRLVRELKQHQRQRRRQGAPESDDQNASGGDGAAETEPPQPTTSGEPSRPAETAESATEPGAAAGEAPAPQQSGETASQPGPMTQQESPAAAPAQQDAVPETDTLYTPPDDRAAHQTAFSESVYGESAYGKSAYGESVYGKSAYGESAYGESAFSTGQGEAVETPSLAEEAAAGMLPAWLWAATEGVLPSGGGSSDGSLRLSVLLSTIGVTLALLFIGMRLVSQLRGESTLKQTISKLHQRLTVRQEEITVFRTQLETANKQAQESGSAAQLEAALQAAAADQAAAEEELEEARHQTSELGAQVAALEQELAQAQLLLEEQMAHQSQPSSPPIDSMVVETVAKLDAELKQQRKKLMGEMDKLKREKKRLMEELSHTKPMIKQLETKLASIGDNKISAEEEERSRHQIEELTLRQTKLTQQCADLTSERDASAEKVSELESEAAAARQQQQAAQDQVDTLHSEVDALRTMLKSLEQSSENGSEEKIQNLLEGSKLKVQVEKLTKERAKLKEKWKQERELLKKSQASVEEKSSELTQLSERCEKAEVDKFEAESKLDHLEKYFQKKEVSFQEEIGVLKSRMSLTEGDNTSSHDLVQRLTEEVAQYKAMTDTLKQEIQDQERSFRSQIQALEKRSHESWVTCRQAERRLEEANREAAQYRALLTKTEEEKHNLVNGQAVLQSFNGTGTGAVSPVLDVSSDPLLSGAPFLPAPPPPLDPFLPPPPPLSDPFLPAPLPPLPPPDGRYDDYSPGARYRDGAESPLSDRSHRSERGYASSGRRGAGRDWSPPRMSRSSYSPERLSERGLSPEPRRRAPLPRYVGGHGSDASGPKTSSPLVADDYGRPPQDKRKPNYPRI